MCAAPVIVPAVTKHTATIIFLHGLGDTGHGWAAGLSQIKPSYAKLICPTASSMPVTLNGGMRMPSWFDLKTLSFSPDGLEDEDGIKRASQLVQGLIQQELDNGIPANRIVLGGFSQGGALALYTGLNSSGVLAGLICLSCWIPLHKQYNWQQVKKPPTLQCHGDSDPLLPLAIGTLTSQILKQNLTDFEFKTYSGLGHSSCEPEMNEVKSFIARVIPQI